MAHTAAQTNAERKRPRRRGPSRGTASVEAIVALPFFLIVFVSILYMRDVYLTKEVAQVAARRVAWTASWNGCPDEQGAGACGQPSSPGDAYCAAPAPSIDLASTARTDLATAIGDTGGGLKKVLDDLVDDALAPFLANVFYDSIDARSARTLSRPSLYGGGQGIVVRHYHLACNLKPTNFSDGVKCAAKRLFGIDGNCSML